MPRAEPIRGNAWRLPVATVAMNSHLVVPILAGCFVALTPTPAQPIQGVHEIGRVIPYSTPNGMATYFRNQGELLDFDSLGAATSVNDFLSEFSGDWRRAADSAIDGARQFTDMLDDPNAPAVKVQVWASFVDLALALNAISNDLVDGSADDADGFFDAADAYADFATLLPSIDVSLVPAGPAFQAAEDAMDLLGLHVQNASVGLGAVEFLDGLVAFKDTQLAIADVLINLTDNLAAPGPISNTTHPIRGDLALESLSDSLMSNTPWAAYAVGYLVGTTANPNITVWDREEHYLRTLTVKTVDAGFASEWDRFFCLGGTAFSTSTTFTSTTATNFGSDPTVGTLP